MIATARWRPHEAMRDDSRKTRVVLPCAVMLFLSFAATGVVAQEEGSEPPELPPGLAPTASAQEDDEDDPALPEGLGGDEQGDDGPALPEGLGGEQQAEPALPDRKSVV